MYCRKEMVKIFKCYLIPKKIMALCPRVQFFLANPVETDKVDHAGCVMADS